MDLKALKKWIKDQRKAIKNPDDDPEIGKIDELDLELDEGQQAQLQLLGELEEFLKTVTKKTTKRKRQSFILSSD